MLNLRVDHILEFFKDNTYDTLRKIHEDELLSKREVDGLWIANASKELHSPTEWHQQLAKGIVYTADFKLVSLPLAKMWNAHEMEQDQAEEVNDLWADEDHTALLYILEKLDGTCLSRFVYNNKVYLSTRGVLLGDEYDSDYVQQALAIANEKYPLLMDPRFMQNQTLIFELLFPEGRILTDYGDRRDLVLIACFDGYAFRYKTYQELIDISEYLHLTLVQRYVAMGNGPWEQMDNLLEQIKGTDAEGFMMTIEQNGQLVYRMKFKGADYIRMLRLMNYCTYKHVVEMILDDRNLLSRDAFMGMLKQNSGDDLPQYVIDEYMILHNKYNEFVDGVTQYCVHMKKFFDTHIENKTVPLSREDKKWFAHFVALLPDKGFYFKFADGKTVDELAESICKDARQDVDYLEKYGVTIVYG
jgi:hypothetical protein